MFFDKLVEQHRVHRFVANGVDFALGIVNHQIRVYFRHVLGDQPKFRRVSGPLVAELTGLSARIDSLVLAQSA